jgi:hypothetical protein
MRLGKVIHINDSIVVDARNFKRRSDLAFRPRIATYRYVQQHNGAWPHS